MEKTEWEMPADVAAVRSEIEAWRANRKKRAPVPSSIWSAATALAQRYSVYRISQALRLNYGGLKRRLVGLSGETTKSSTGDDENVAGRKFVELSGVGTMAAVPQQAASIVAGNRAGDYVEVEVSDGSGARMTVRVTNDSQVDLTGLVGTFWSRHQ